MRTLSRGLAARFVGAVLLALAPSATAFCYHNPVLGRLTCVESGGSRGYASPNAGYGHNRWAPVGGSYSSQPSYSPPSSYGSQSYRPPADSSYNPPAAPRTYSGGYAPAGPAYGPDDSYGSWRAQQSYSGHGYESKSHSPYAADSYVAPPPAYASYKSANDYKPASTQSYNNMYLAMPSYADNGGTYSNPPGSEHRPGTYATPAYNSPPQTGVYPASYGSATPPHAPSGGGGPQSKPACFGSLPFGLEACVCDGEAIGQVASIAGCAALVAECGDLLPFSVTDDLVGRVSHACDSISATTCQITALDASNAQPGCPALLAGNSRCSAAKARSLFEATVKRTCEPLCPTCDRRPQEQFPGDGILPLIPLDGTCLCPPNGSPVCATDSGFWLAPNAACARCDGHAEGSFVPCTAIEPSKAAPQSGTQPGPGCRGGLPFGLENCVCDGAALGDAVGMAACTEVLSKCTANAIQPLAAAEVLQRACDKITHHTCLDSARAWAMQHQACSDILQGRAVGASCSLMEAQRAFGEASRTACQPLCVDC